MLSPEFSVWSNHWHFSDLTIAAGAVLNLKFGGFFLGGGFVAMTGGGYGGIHYYKDGQWHTRAAIRPKFNLGYRARHFKLMMSGTPIDDGIAGVLSAGIGF
jgi:hypothetical protein